jgi:hypothetical protein
MIKNWKNYYLGTCIAALIAVMACADAEKPDKKSPAGNPDLVAHSNEFRKEVIEVTEGVYVAVGYGLANSVLLEGEDGVVIVDTLESAEAAAPVKEAFRNITAKPVKAVIYTHYHTDHTFGAGVMTGDDSPKVISHATTSTHLERIASITRETTYRRAMRQFGNLLPEGGVINAGIGPDLKFNQNSTIALLTPTDTFSGRQIEIEIAGIKMVLIHVARYWTDISAGSAATPLIFFLWHRMSAPGILLSWPGGGNSAFRTCEAFITRKKGLIMKVTLRKAKIVQLSVFISILMAVGVPEISIAVDKIYWTSEEIGKIQRADTDGGDIEDIITEVYSESIAVDEKAGKIYWPDSDGIRRANLDGSNVEFRSTTGSPEGIAIDVDAGKLYWSDDDELNGKILRSNLDGSAVEEVVTGLSGPGGIELYFHPQVEPCLGDLDTDKDVGKDLSVQTDEGMGVDLKDFVDNYGRINCP